MDPRYVAAHLAEDRAHWWFRGRLEVVLATLRRRLPPRPLRLLELGCGSGNVLGALAEFGEAVGMETHGELVAAARAAGLDVRQGTLPDDIVVPAGWPQVVLLLDVLEHVDDERATLDAACGLLAPGGHLVVTVPAYQWLWSGHDVLLGHRRRYTATRLMDVVEAAGFTVRHVTYFNTLLFPAVVAVRVAKRLAGRADHDLVRPPARLNRALGWLFALERFVVPRCRLGFGSSLLLVARR